jgi:D-glycero-D-manno-heptose 1,7-bisphosphate phosphatase
MQMKKRAVFIDRDGTLSEEVGYVNHPTRFRLFPYAAEALKLLHERGWLAIVITNQAGVARGYFSETMVQTVHELLISQLKAAGAGIDAIYYCAHHPSIGDAPYRFECDCRKPKPGLIIRAAHDFDIDLEDSWMIGDRFSDVELARNAGVKSVLVMSGYGRGEWEHQRHKWKHLPDITAEDLLDAIKKLRELDAGIRESKA